MIIDLNQNMIGNRKGVQADFGVRMRELECVLDRPYLCTARTEVPLSFKLTCLPGDYRTRI